MNTAQFNREAVLAIVQADLAELKRLAAASPKRRYRLCMHRSVEDATQEMVIVCRGDTVMPPHRHPIGRSESYHIIEGTMTVCFFDNSGLVIRRLEMAPFGSGKPFLYRLSDSLWHAPVPTSDWLVYHETLTGPYAIDGVVEFPSWLPSGTSEAAIDHFLRLALRN